MIHSRTGDIVRISFLLLPWFPIAINQTKLKTMKKIITSVALIFCCTFAVAQDYTVKMNMKIEGLPPEAAGFGEQETVTQIKGEKTKTEMTSMMGSTIMLFDGKTHTFLTDMMGNKAGYTATKEEMEAMAKDDKEPKPKIEYTTEKKTIAGYECTKAVVTTVGKDKKEQQTIVWITDKIKHNMPKNKNRGMMDLSDLKGYPLEMEMHQSQQGMDMKIMITASEVSTAPIDDSVFAVNTEGYKMSTYKEFSEKMKAQRGGH